MHISAVHLLLNVQDDLQDILNKKEVDKLEKKVTSSFHM